MCSGLSAVRCVVSNFSTQRPPVLLGRLFEDLVVPQNHLVKNCCLKNHSLGFLFGADSRQGLLTFFQHAKEDSWQNFEVVSVL